MIDIATEELLALKDVSALLPRRRKGRRPTFSCVWRWATTGCRGVKLETVRIGSTLCTTRGALQRFFRCLSQEAAVESAGDPGAGQENLAEVKRDE